MKRIGLGAVVASVLLFSTLGTAKVSPELRDRIGENPGQERVDVIILTQGQPNERALSAIRGAGGQVGSQFSLIDGVEVSLPAAAVENLASRDFVREVQPDFQVETNLDETVEYVNVTSDMNASGEGVDVAVVDTGVEDSSSRLDVEMQKDFTGEGTDDGNGHGTHVAGIVASQDSQYTGVSPNVDLYDAKVLQSDGTGSGSDVIDGIEWAVENDAEVVSLSLGADVETCDGTDAISEAVDEARSRGTLVVVSAGNLGPDEGTITAPGCAEGALTVGSTNLQDEVSDFSSRGPTADGRSKPDVVAPGESVTSTWNDGGFETLSGTSMATPHVSGAAALLMDANETLTANEAEEAITSTSEDLGYGSNVQGAGLVDASSALDQVTFEAQNETSEQVLSVEALAPLNGESGVNDTDDFTGVDVNLRANVTAPENSTVESNFSFEGSEIANFTGTGVLETQVENLSTNTTYSWSVDTASDGNTTSTGTLYFVTAAEDNETEETDNRTNRTLPPGLAKQNKTPPGLKKERTPNPFMGGFFGSISRTFGLGTARNASGKEPGEPREEEKNQSGEVDRKQRGPLSGIMNAFRSGRERAERNQAERQQRNGKDAEDSESGRPADSRSDTKKTEGGETEETESNRPERDRSDRQQGEDQSSTQSGESGNDRTSLGERQRNQERQDTREDRNRNPGAQQPDQEDERQEQQDADRGNDSPDSDETRDSPQDEQESDEGSQEDTGQNSQEPEKSNSADENSPGQSDPESGSEPESSSESEEDSSDESGGSDAGGPPSSSPSGSSGPSPGGRGP